MGIWISVIIVGGSLLFFGAGFAMGRKFYVGKEVVRMQDVERELDEIIGSFEAIRKELG